jgi:hypothetical protein
MRPRLRLILTASLLTLSLVLAGCADFDIDKFDLDSLDVFGWNKKKPLPGDRKDVFPDGVPGVSQGVPPELVKGYQAPPDTAATDPALAAAERIAGEEKPPPKPKPKKTAKVTPPKPKSPQPTTQTQPQQGTQAPWPSQQPQQTSQQAQGAWPSQPQQQQSAPQQTAPWPSSH